MNQYIGCDAHKKYSVFVPIDETGHFGPAKRVEHNLELLDQLQKQISQAEQRIHRIVNITPEMQLLMSLPGIGPVLAVLICFEGQARGQGHGTYGHDHGGERLAPSCTSTLTILLHGWE